MAKKGKKSEIKNCCPSIHDFFRGLTQLRPGNPLSETILGITKTNDPSEIKRRKRQVFTPKDFCDIVDSISAQLIRQRQYSELKGEKGVYSHALDIAYFAGGDRFGDEVLRILKLGY